MGEFLRLLRELVPGRGNRESVLIEDLFIVEKSHWPAVLRDSVNGLSIWRNLTPGPGYKERLHIGSAVFRQIREPLRSDERGQKVVLNLGNVGPTGTGLNRGFHLLVLRGTAA